MEIEGETFVSRFKFLLVVTINASNFKKLLFINAK